MMLTQSKNFWKLEQTWTEYIISYVVLKMFVFCKVCIVRTLRTFLYIRISKQSRPTDVILISYTRYFTLDNMFNKTLTWAYTKSGHPDRSVLVRLGLSHIEILHLLHWENILQVSRLLWLSWDRLGPGDLPDPHVLDEYRTNAVADISLLDSPENILLSIYSLTIIITH